MPRITKAEVREAAERDVNKNRKFGKEENRDTIRKEKDLKQFALPVYSEGEGEIVRNQEEAAEPVIDNPQPVDIPTETEVEDQNLAPTKEVSVSEFDPKLIPYSPKPVTPEVKKVKKVFAIDEDVIENLEYQIAQLTAENGNLLQQKDTLEQKVGELTEQVVSLNEKEVSYKDKIAELSKANITLADEMEFAKANWEKAENNLITAEKKMEEIKDNKEIEKVEEKVDTFAEDVATWTGRIGVILLSIALLGVFGILVAKLLFWLIVWLF